MARWTTWGSPPRSRHHQAPASTPCRSLGHFDDVELVLQALRAGARGYLLKDVTLDQLVGAVRTLADGGTLIEPAITDRLIRALRASRPGGGLGDDLGDTVGPDPDLTERELEVLRLIASGYANREIASALHLAEGTVKNHVSNLPPTADR